MRLAACVDSERAGERYRSRTQKDDTMKTVTKLASIIAGGVLLCGGAARAAGTPEETCLLDLTKAAGKYAQCMQAALAKFYRPDDLFYPYAVYQPLTGKCLVRYTAAWAKVQLKSAGNGSTCDNPRYDTVTAPGTVIDRLTGLQWERKTNDSTVHDKDNDYTWTTGSSAASGTVFTTFLATLNGGGCFAGHCDWRLPTKEELWTTTTEPSCATPPCIDAAFGPAVTSAHWTSSNFVELPAVAWVVSTTGFIGADNKLFPDAVRAVRALR